MKHHHHDPKHGPHHHGPKHGPGRRDWYTPLPDELDLGILEEILQDRDQAKAVFRIFTTSPPEISMLGCLLLRQFKILESQIKEIASVISMSEKKPKKMSLGKLNEDPATSTTDQG